MKAGYSLIEIMVVLTLFSLLILVATQTLLLSLRSSHKSESVGRVKENLELAVSVMERQIRNADSIPDCPNSDTSRLEYFDYEGFPSVFSCESVGQEGYVASGSARLTNQNILITSCSLSCSQNPGETPAVTISLSAEDNSSSSGAEHARASLETTVLLRQY